MSEERGRECCPGCGKPILRLDVLDESDMTCPSCGVVIHWQGSTPWIDGDLMTSDGRPWWTVGRHPCGVCESAGWGQVKTLGLFTVSIPICARDNTLATFLCGLYKPKLPEKK